MKYNFLLIIFAAMLIAGCLSTNEPKSHMTGLSAASIPADYYLNQKPADVDSPIELLRFATSIKADTSGLDIPMRAAYYQWYLKNRGFNVSFAYSNDFRNQGTEHIWLLVKNQMGECMYVDPSSDLMKADSICPTGQEYKKYDAVYSDIEELSENTGGTAKYAWWQTTGGERLYNNSIMLMKKRVL